MHGRTTKLPAVLIADEFMYTMHLQERGEGKWKAGHTTWGAFGKWGVTQLAAIKTRLNFEKLANTDDSLEFAPARSPREFWSTRTKTEEGDGGKKKRTITVFVPECYPVTITRSFLEETSTKDKTPLLEYLRTGRDIPWNDENKGVEADPWGGYVITKFNKAVKLVEYFNPGKPMETQKRGWAKEWAEPLIELFLRLDIKDTIQNLYKEKKTFQTFANLKAWAVYAALGGVKDVQDVQPTLNISAQDEAILEGALSKSRVNYLESSGIFSREGLEIK